MRPESLCSEFQKGFALQLGSGNIFVREEDQSSKGSIMVMNSYMSAELSILSETQQQSHSHSHSLTLHSITHRHRLHEPILGKDGYSPPCNLQSDCSLVKVRAARVHLEIYMLLEIASNWGLQCYNSLITSVHYEDMVAQ